MTTSRRDFVQLSILAGGAVGLGLAKKAVAEVSGPGTASEKLKIHVLGGTGLIGPPMVEYAIARGHEVTLFNRGKTNVELFPDLEKLKGDRNDDLSAIEAEVKKGRRWDAVIDNTASIPRWVTEPATSPRTRPTTTSTLRPSPRTRTPRPRTRTRPPPLRP